MDNSAKKISKPFHRLWRPVRGYDWAAANFIIDNDCSPKATLDYLQDDRFANQDEKKSLFMATRLIIRDLNELFDYIEPDDENLKVHSHRIYELLLRTATEFEANCKGILKANNYSKEEKCWDIKDYFKISRAARLSEYRVIFQRWSTSHEFQPLLAWNPSRRETLLWYDAYNKVKHDRFKEFKSASLENLMNAVAGLLSILHAQYGEDMAEVGFSGIGTTGVREGDVETEMFTIHAPVFPDAEQYDFIWDKIKDDANPVETYLF